MLDRFVGGPPRLLGKWSRVWSIAFLFLTPFFVYYVLSGDKSLLWNFPFICFALGGVTIALSRLWYRRRRLAYGLQATSGAFMFQAGMIAFIVGLGIRGDWEWFWYSFGVYGGLLLLAATGVLYYDSSTRDRQRVERS